MGSNGTGDLADVWQYVSSDASWHYAGATSPGGSVMVGTHGSSIVEPHPDSSFGAALVARDDELWMFFGFSPAQSGTPLFFYTLPYMGVYMDLNAFYQ